MTGICGLVGPDARETTSRLEGMLDALAVRGSSRRTIVRRAGGRIFALGIREHPAQVSHGLVSNGQLTLAVDGDSYDQVSDRIIESSPPSESSVLEGFFRHHDAWALIGLGSISLYVSRDPLGLKPLYHASQHGGGTLGFASTKTALSTGGFSDPEPFPTGRVLSIPDDKPPSVNDQHRLQNPQPDKNLREEKALERLGALLVESARGSIPDHCGIAFSGGLDSSLVAKASVLAGKKEIELFTVGLEEREELAHAEKAADEMGLPLTIRKLTRQEVVDFVPLVVKATESIDPVIIGVSLPFYAVCQMVRAKGLTHIAAGQLSDELFGGYARFEELAGNDATLRREVWESVSRAPTNDFEPGDKIAVSQGLELRCPFAYLPLVQYSLALPSRLKVRIVDGKPVRKYVLRHLATEWGMPDFVANRPKRAIQYSTGIMPILEKEARSRRLGLREFLEAQVVQDV